MRRDGGGHFFVFDDDDDDDDHGFGVNGEHEHDDYDDRELACVLGPRSVVSLASELERAWLSGAVLEVSWDLVLAQVSHRSGAVSES